MDEGEPSKGFGSAEQRKAQALIAQALKAFIGSALSYQLPFS